MTNEENQKKEIELSVLSKIEQGEIKMTPKLYFVAKAGALIFVAFAIFVISSILVSFIIFSLLNRGDLFLLSFGTKGIYKFILLFPWYLLSVGAFLLVLLDYLLRRFKYGYNSPLAYLFLATLVFVTLFSFLINFTSFHLRLEKYVKANNIRFVRDMYGNALRSHREKGVIKGVVSFVGDNYIVVSSSGSDLGLSDEEYKVYSPSGMSPGNFVKIGDEIYIAGDIATGTEIISYGIQRMTIPGR
ncbi:MAG: hypothetical protein WAW92_02240 [Minisyncoccia bacterium]